jgi:hypothetical protein
MAHGRGWRDLCGGGFFIYLLKGICHDRSHGKSFFFRELACPGTFSGSLGSEDPHTRSRAVGQLTDQELLERIASNDPDRQVRRAAVMRIACEQALFRIACRDHDYYVRQATLSRIRSGRLLAEVILGKQDDYYFCKEALAGIQDEDVLAGLVEGLTDRDIKSAVVQRISDQDLLAAIACSQCDFYVRAEALKKITDRSVLRKLALHDPDYYVRALAVNQLDDPELLAHIAANDPDYNVRGQAVLRISDETVLAGVVRCDPDLEVRKKALENIRKYRHSGVNLFVEAGDAFLQRAVRARLTSLGFRMQPGGEGAAMTTPSSASNGVWKHLPSPPSETDPCLCNGPNNGPASAWPAPAFFARVAASKVVEWVFSPAMSALSLRKVASW